MESVVATVSPYTCHSETLSGHGQIVDNWRLRIRALRHLDRELTFTATFRESHLRRALQLAWLRRLGSPGGFGFGLAEAEKAKALYRLSAARWTAPLPGLQTMEVCAAVKLGEAL